MTERASDRLGWAVSVGFHALLALLFMWQVFELKPFELEFTLVSFSGATQVEPQQSASMPALEGQSPRIELPRRPMLEDASPLLKLPENVRREVIAPLPSEKPELATNDPSLLRRRIESAAEAPSLRERADIKPLPLSDEVLMGERQDVLGARIAGDEMFSIEWEGVARQKISGALPKFPPGVQKEATVQIGFDVAPDGTVVFATPQTKGVPEFEKVALDALRSWRFNSLPQGSAQDRQKGVVTFHFKLE